jgi:methyltransferase
VQRWLLTSNACPLRACLYRIDARLTPGIRCTVQIDPALYSISNSSSTTTIPGKVVSPSTPRETSGAYWGYTTRLAAGIKAVFDDCPYGAYDLSIGTSERGTQNVDRTNYIVPAFKHALVVFGGVAGIEECVDADESLKVSGSMSYTLFDQWYVQNVSTVHSWLSIFFQF